MPYRIFVVEDHPVMRDACAFVIQREADLELCGFAGSAEETLALFDGVAEDPGAEAPMACDLVVADVSLPGMDGIEMTARLRARRPDLAVLVISAYEEDVFVRRALAAGAFGFLSKLGLERTLVEAIRQALRGGPGVGLADGDEPHSPLP